MGHLPALVGLQYHIAKLLGDAGAPRFAAWAKKARRVAALEARLPPEHRMIRRIPPPETAARILKAEHQRLTSALHDAESDVAKAERAADQAANSKVAQAKAHRERLQHSLKIVPVAHKIARGTIQEGIDFYAKEAKNDAQVARFGKLLKILEAPGALADADLAVIDWNQTGIDSCGTTTVTVTGKVRTAVVDLTPKYSQLSDPALWAQNTPDSFKTTYAAYPDCPSVSNSPRPVNPAPAPGTTWGGQLFEVADVAVMPGEANELRNLLNIDFTAAKTAVSLKYSLYESLTSSLFGVESQGGIDADSGFGSVNLDGSSLIMTGQKSIRFTEANPFGEFMNMMALPWLLPWLKALIEQGLKA